jgi:hypothetical protein
MLRGCHETEGLPAGQLCPATEGIRTPRTRRDLLFRYQAPAVGKVGRSISKIFGKAYMNTTTFGGKYLMGLAFSICFVNHSHTPAAKLFHDAVMRDGCAGKRSVITH